MAQIRMVEEKRVCGDFPITNEHVLISLIDEERDSLDQQDEWISEWGVKKNMGRDWAECIKKEMDRTHDIELEEALMEFNKATNFNKKNKLIRKHSYTKGELRFEDLFNMLTNDEKVNKNEGVSFHDMEEYEFEGGERMLTTEFEDGGKIKNAWFRKDDMDLLSKLLFMSPNDEISHKSIGYVEVKFFRTYSRRTYGFLYIHEKLKDVARKYITIKEIEDPRG